MDFSFGAEDEELRGRARAWLTEHLVGPYAHALGLGGPGSEHEGVDVRRAWERELGRGGWIGQGWDAPDGAYGQRRLSLTGQVVWAEEYAALRAPGRVGHIGENLLAPTLIAYGTPEQQGRFLPGIARGEELWCQGYSEPGAYPTSRASVPPPYGTRPTGSSASPGRRSGPRWPRTPTGASCWPAPRPASRRHRGLSFLLVRMDQPGRVEVRPIRQMSGTAEFNEVFFDGAVAAEAVGAEGDGWTVAMGLLALERGVSTLVQQIGFAAELERIVRLYAASGAADPIVQGRLVRQWAELRTMRWNALRTLGAADDPGAPSVAKLLWGGWHRRLGELAVEVRGAAASAGPVGWAPGLPYELGLDEGQRLFLFTRADTIYGGSDEIQRNIIAERVLGLPKESR